MSAPLLVAALGAAQAATPADGSATSAARWHTAVLDVTVDGTTWSQAIPFDALANSRAYRQRFAQSTVTAQQNMRPDGANRMAQAEFKGHTWLRWGEGTAPLALDAVDGWPYRLVADPTANVGQPQYRWSNADASQQITALPNTVQKVKTPQATWCSWFSVTGTQEARPNIADGPVPRIRWMLWQRPANASCR